jgi:hypothetical protein
MVSAIGRTHPGEMCQRTNSLLTDGRYVAHAKLYSLYKNDEQLSVIELANPFIAPSHSNRQGEAAEIPS